MKQGIDRFALGYKRGCLLHGGFWQNHLQNSYYFNIPDLRGLFLRGVDYDAEKDPNKAGRVALKTGGNTGNNVGSYQADIYQRHRHNNTHSATNSSNRVGSGSAVRAGQSTNYTEYSGGSETRPKNAYVNYIIKY